MTKKKLTLENGTGSGEGKGQRLSLPNTEWFPDESISLMKKIIIVKVHRRMGYAMVSGGFLEEVTNKMKPEGGISQVREENVPS